MKNKQDENEIVIDILGLTKFLLRWSWMVILIAVIGGSAALAANKLILTPEYESKTMLYVLSKSTSITSFADIQIGNALTNDLIVIVTSKPVVDNARENILNEYGISLSRSDILDMISVSNKDDTRILEISARHTDAELACIVANAMGQETARQMAFIMKTDTPTTIEQAEASLDPVTPSVSKNTAMAIGFSGVATVLILSIIFIMNDNIITEADVEKYLNLKVLAILPETQEPAEKGRKRRGLRGETKGNVVRK
ncbi:MAG: YveK family protein [Lachnospiraceae bacterium]